MKKRSSSSQSMSPNPKRFAPATKQQAVNETANHEATPQSDDSGTSAVQISATVSNELPSVEDLTALFPKYQTLVALLTVRKMFPVLRFHWKVPPVVMQHQLYDLIPLRSTSNLQSAGKLCVFSIGVEKLSRAVILTVDLLKSSKVCYPNNPLIEKFLSHIIPLGVSEVDKEDLSSHFAAKEISGYLVYYNEACYRLSFPNAGHFMKAYVQGRQIILRTIRKSQQGEILESTLEDRKLDKSVSLGVTYHIHDVAGADLVQKRIHFWQASKNKILRKW
ncbi:hypothetical protein B566_EDAN009100 [Ephemera danica]|nr:hypothetical protein B566_EDAN009100 [Ephemera danica]